MSPFDRRAALLTAGASLEVAEELLVYGTALLPPEGEDVAARPGRPTALALHAIEDEPHLTAWRRYADEAASMGGFGAFAALAHVFPQLRFPIRKGISETEAYRAATRRGIAPEDEDAPGLGLVRPDLVSLTIHRTLASHVPIVLAKERADFEALVCAFSARNEPVAVPPSMGACLVRGLNNWDRIREHRRAFEAANPDGDWAEGFRALRQRPELYEDRFILLSDGPYSGLPAGDAGLPESEWHELSYRIRRDHEAAHYFTLRVAGQTRNNLVDELIADYAGLVGTLGRYDAELALRFFGLEAFPSYREGARLQNYRGKPPLSDPAFEFAKRLTHDAVRNLATLDRALPAFTRSRAGFAEVVLFLATLSLEELAWIDLTVVLPKLHSLSARFAGDRSGIELAIEAFAGFAERVSLPQRIRSEMHLVLDEELSNKVKYAWPVGGSHEIGLSMRLDEGCLEVEITDDGRAFDPLAVQEPDLGLSVEERPIGGLGVYLVRKLTDEQRYERRDGQNRSVLRKRLA